MAGRKPRGRKHTAGSTPAPADLVAGEIDRGLRRMVGAELRILLDGDPVAVRRARVATRRIRSDLRTFGATFDRTWTVRMRAELTWLSGALADVRDADVLTAHLRDHLAGVDPADRRPFAELVAVLAEERRAALEHLRAVLGSGRARALRTELETAVTAGPPPAAGPRAEPTRRTSERQVRRAVRTSWRRLRRDAARLGPRPTDEQLHQVRIRTKQLRYALEAAGPSVGAPDAPLLVAATALQDCLGALNDAGQAEWWFRGVWASGTPAAAYAAGICAAGERATRDRARLLWPDRWQDMRRAARRHRW